MKSSQFTPVTSIEQRPLQRFAHEAVAAYRSTFRNERALKLAQAGIRFDASRRLHVLGNFRQVIDKPAYREATCANCGAGVSIHVATAEFSINALLEQPCPMAHGLRG